MKKTVSILGMGRFGKILADILQDAFPLVAYDLNPDLDNAQVEFVDLETACSKDTIFICVPIRQFEKLIQQISRLLKKNCTVIDTCSVKTFPAKIMQRDLPKQVDIIATHPMFGPDSYQTNAPLRMMMHPLRDTRQSYDYWKSCFEEKNIKMVEITPDEHDRMAAQSQCVTHFIGRILQAIHAHETPIDTLGYQKLLAVMEQTCNDSFELFSDLVHFNPYGKKMIELLLRSAVELDKRC